MSASAAPKHSPEIIAAVDQLAEVDERIAAAGAAHAQALDELNAEREPITEQVEALAREALKDWDKQSTKVNGYKIAFRKHADLVILPVREGETEAECKARLGRKLLRTRGGRAYTSVLIDLNKIRSATKDIKKLVGVTFKPQPGLQFSIKKEG